ncbi:MAG: protein tyrosine phosphatase family protein [Gammaproteobacteria bacterium]|nr:protein tyrosine phosphatase family protein [Gammaproteobacteria bacterium]MDP2141168.1 protein tyrosine phosphatase family protein [Gammaproteobacteria bacterium]MDP2349158.1 protein tyrosine phosphatase family protein [Gammaproteobacteria bacterium]
MNNPFNKSLLHVGFVVTMSVFMSTVAQAQETTSAKMSEILNFREYSSTFASAGQPTREQLELIRDSGYERVIYIAFSTVGPAIPEEDQLVKALGMDYLHIPVDFNNPTIRDFNAFADAMRREPDTKTLLHCQINARATAFSFLYRVIYEDVPVAQAKADMNSVWHPNQVWKDFIFDVLAQSGKSAECENCDWSVPAPRQ